MKKVNSIYSQLNNKKKAFTLIELLIVIAIIGILFIVLVSKVDFATDKAKATGVQTDFRSFQMAFDQVARENAGFNTLGWDTGDDNGDRIRNSYDKGDKECGQSGCTECKQDGQKGPHEVWVGSKIYGETWNAVFTLVNPSENADTSAFIALENAINANLDPKLHITITPEVDGTALTGNATITMANQARDPWQNEYHGAFITNSVTDSGADRGAIVMYSDGANGKWGSAHDITNGVVSVTVPGNNVNGKDDYSLVSCYTFTNGYGEVLNISTGFSNNKSFLTNGNTGSAPLVPGGSGGNEPGVNEPIPVVTSATFNDETTLSWEELQLPENGAKYGYSVAGITNTSIEDDAFRNCSDLVSLTIPDSVTTIGKKAFNGCSQLISVTIGNGVTSIGDYAFASCRSLTSIVISDSVTNIGESAFGGCSSLTSIEIPDSVTSIGPYAFQTCKNLTSVTIPDSVTSIGNNTFYYCRGLTSVTIGNGVTSISNSAFYYCSNLTSVVIPDNVTSIGDGAFKYCTGLTSVTIGNGVTNIGNKAFEYCSSLANLTIPDSVTSIGEYAFEYCTNLTSVTIGNGVTRITAYAFRDCDSLTSVTFGNSVTVIGMCAFEGCDNLTSLTIPDSVTSIHNNAFQYCSSLTSVTIGNSVPNIGPYAFRGCDSLTNVVIPDSVTIISSSAFEDCTSLTSITFNGTIAQWNAVTKGSQWKNGVPATYVQCSDGQVDI